MKTATLCAMALLLVVSSWAFAVSVDRDITAGYVKSNPKEFTVTVTEEANELLAFTVVLTTPDPRYVVAHLVVRDSEKIYATSDTPSFTKNRSNTFHFSIPRDLVATSTFSLGVSGFADSGGAVVPLPGTITNKLQLLDFVPQKAAGIKGVTFHLSSGEDFLVDKDTVIAKLANVVQPSENTKTDVAAPAKPFRYNVALVLREYANGESYGMTSLSLPIVTEDVPATIELKTGTIVVSAKATVTHPEKTAMATINVTFSRDGKQIASPDLAITIGRRGVVRVGDKDGISLEAILVGE